MATFSKLTPDEESRLTRLARETGSTPQEMIEDALRFGVGSVEQDVSENLRGLAEAESGTGVSHSEVIARAERLLAVVERIQTYSQAQGLDKFSAEDIEAEIDAVRRIAKTKSSKL